MAQRISHVDIEVEMQRSYLDYAMSVIVGRALPEVRDGLKPVHRRILYAMYDGGYRPDAGFYKSMRVVGDVMSHYHPHGDAAVYDALARLVQPWSMRYPLVSGQGNFGSPGNLGPAAPRYTECRMHPMAMEMVRDIDEDTVDFIDNYDGRNQEPTVLPSRFPNLLVNGSEGIAVGMATRIPPHNLREVAAGVQWHLDHPEATREELLEALLGIIKGPDFPTGATILGRSGIEQVYRTGRGPIVQRADVAVEEIRGRTCLVVTSLPYQVNPDNLAAKIAQLTKDGVLQGIADIRDETSGRSGMRLVLVLKRDAVPKVVLNNLYKRTQLQDSFPANMLALVDGVPRTLSLDGFIYYWTKHQIDVLVRRTKFRLAKARERLHILDGYLKALDVLDEVIALIRRSATVADARAGLMDFLEIDEVQADAILAMQLRRLAALERQKILDEHKELSLRVADLEDVIAKPERQRTIVGEELGEIVDRFGDERRTRIVPFMGEMSTEDLIPEEDVVVTITRDGFAKRTRVDAYKSQHRGGKGIRGAKLREDDVVQHFFVTTTHHWLLFFTNLGRVYRAKAYEVPEGGRDSRGQHVANLMAFQPDEEISDVLAIRDYDQADYLVLATKSGLVKKTALQDYNSPRTGGLIAINLREVDGELDSVVSAKLVNADDNLILISKNGQALRFEADDESVRPMGRATSGVRGMKFRDDDYLLSLDVIDPSSDLFVITEGGFAKRSAIDTYPTRGRGGLGVKVANLVDERGDLVAGLEVTEEDEVLVIMESGNIVRSAVSEVPRTGRTTQGVTFARPAKGDRIIAITKNLESQLDDEGEEVDSDESEVSVSGEGAVEGTSAEESGTDDSAPIGTTVDEEGDE
ncbi:MAG: DNA gyrase subunit A [Actinomycetaceae bacterium]|nr:DNA gyrase subunit A [Actinomycetaceae bacterium]